MPGAPLVAFVRRGLRPGDDLLLHLLRHGWEDVALASDFVWACNLCNRCTIDCPVDVVGYLPGFEEPETVWVSVPAGEVLAGPADDRLHVVDAIDKAPYRFPYLPPHAGDAHPPAEAQLMREIALAAGLPAERILLEEGSANTFENAVNAARILHDRGWRRILLVSDGYHLPRALFVFRRLGLIVDGSAAPANPHDRPWFAAAVRLREVAAWAWYLYRVFARDRQIITAHRAGVVRGNVR